MKGDGEVAKRRYRVGYWMSEKKCRKFCHTGFTSMCRKHGLELVQIELTKPLEEQGPFDAILHKLTDVIVKADAIGNVVEDEVREHKRIVKAFEQYLAANPQVVVIDPIDNVRLLLDRLKTYQLIEESPLAKEDGVFTPNFVELTTTDLDENLKLLQRAGVTFPFVCKPSVAHGSRLAHQMAVIFNEEGVKDITPPCVAQAFICHNAVLYKLFAVGDKWYQVERPSLKNFHASEHRTIFFDSHDVSKANATSSLNQLDVADLQNPVPTPSQAQFEKIMKTLRDILGMALFGVDVVIDNKSDRYAIIDINAFPGYDGVPDLYATLIACIIEEIENRKVVSMCAPTIPDSEAAMDINQDDSGIDTGDSSDEKKKKRIVKQIRRQHPRTISSV